MFPDTNTNCLYLIGTWFTIHPKWLHITGRLEIELQEQKYIQTNKSFYQQKYAKNFCHALWMDLHLWESSTQTYLFENFLWFIMITFGYYIRHCSQLNRWWKYLANIYLPHSLSEEQIVNLYKRSVLIDNQFLQNEIYEFDDLAWLSFRTNLIHKWN